MMRSLPPARRQQIAGGGREGTEARTHAVTECFLHEGVDGGGRGVGQLDQELASAAEERTEESGDGERRRLTGRLGL